MSLKPSEYLGDTGTCVFGRAVLIRPPFTPEAQGGQSAGPALGKGNKAGKGKKGKKRKREREREREEGEREKER